MKPPHDHSRDRPGHDDEHPDPAPRKHRLALFLSVFTGLAALIWCLARVVPKPSRVTYPCQRVALPIAGGFLVWLAHITGSIFLFRAGRRYLARSRLGVAIVCVALASLLGAVAFLTTGERTVLADPQDPNQPIGTAQGVHPGRVTWVHDPDATDWNGPGDGHWWEPSHTNQAVVDRMMSQALLALSGEATHAEAWDALFRYFNRTHGRGDIGYMAGEEIVIKLNFVGFHFMVGGVDPDTYELVDWIDYMNTSPQMTLALLRHLVYDVGVEEGDISVGDPTALYPNQYYDYCHDEFPSVHYLDHNGGNAAHPRTPLQHSTTPLYWSSHPTGFEQDYIPQCYVDAQYVINFANFKSHSMAGITAGAKNHFGSLFRYPAEPGYYDMHVSLPSVVPASGSYRCLVDLLGHTHLGGKTALYLVDGLYSGVHPDDLFPRRWQFPPFNGDWTSSLFAAQDAIAIESVIFDFMQEEGDPRQYPQRAGTDDHLHEGALAYDPPSGTFYDPDHEGDVQRLSSLGVHEHWNNSTEMKYSRNLGTGDGVELVIVRNQAGVTDPGDRHAPEAPASLALAIAPNPFNPATTISYELPASTSVDLRIYDISGRLVRVLVNGSVQTPGSHRIIWGGKDDSGRAVDSGVYMCRLEAGSLSDVKRLILAR